MAAESEDLKPHATDEDLKNVVESLYGLKVLSMKRLNGYDDLNIHVKVNMSEWDNDNIISPCQYGYVLKVLNTLDSRLNQQSVAAQVDLLKMLLEKGLVCPKHVYDKEGRFFSEQDLPNEDRGGTTRHVVRLLEYIEGTPICIAGLTNELARQSGELSANMVNMMEGYEDERLRKDESIWNHDNIAKVREYLDYVTDEEYKRIAREFLDKWESLQETITSLPRGLIHYDVNEQNILVREGDNEEKEIAGILDFQETTYGLHVYEIGICIMYLMTVADEPMDVGGYCLQGFLKKHALSQAELDIVYYCVAARFTVSLVLGLYYYSITKDPYVLVTQKSWKVFKQLWDSPAADVTNHWLSPKFQQSK
ncbi:hydroxylysine kinase-like [Watersipora subatra]|uniref:hydroxylysine kinase-like n=1 Tax=Watersipora subatra TaxID=2589382 RepID=UPI00355BC04C